MPSDQVHNCLWQEANPNPIEIDRVRPRRTLETTRALLQDPDFLASADHPPASHPNAKNIYGNTHDTFNNFYHGPNPSPFKARKKRGKGRLDAQWALNTDHVAVTMLDEDDEKNKHQLQRLKEVEAHGTTAVPSGLSGWLHQQNKKQNGSSGADAENAPHAGYPKPPKKVRPVGTLNPNFTPRINPVIWDGKGRVFSPYRAKKGRFGNGNNTTRKSNAAWNNYTRPGVTADLNNKGEENDFDIQISVAPRPRHFLMTGVGPSTAPAAVNGIGKSPRVLNYPSAPQGRNALSGDEGRGVDGDVGRQPPQMRNPTTSGDYGCVENKAPTPRPPISTSAKRSSEVHSAPTFGKPSASADVGGVLPPPRSFIVQSRKALRVRQNNAAFRKHLESVGKLEAKNRIPIRVPLSDEECDDRPTSATDEDVPNINTLTSPRATHSQKLIEALEVMQRNVVVSATGRVYTLPTKHSRIFNGLAEGAVGTAGAFNSAAAAAVGASPPQNAVATDIATLSAKKARPATAGPLLTTKEASGGNVNSNTKVAGLPITHFNFNYPALSGYSHPVEQHHHHQNPPHTATANNNVQAPPLIIVEAQKNAALLEHLRSPRADHGYRGSHHINRRPDEALLIQKHYPLYVQSITKGPQSLMDPKPSLPAVPRVPKLTVKDREEREAADRKEFERAVRKERERRDNGQSVEDQLSSNNNAYQLNVDDILTQQPFTARTIAAPPKLPKPIRPATAVQFRNQPQQETTVPVTSQWLQDNKPTDSSVDASKATPTRRRVMSADVKRRIQELADKYLSPDIAK